MMSITKYLKAHLPKRKPKPQPLMMGDFVKVRLTDGENMERVWAEIVGFNEEKQELDVRIDNHPVSPSWKYNEEITVPWRYVLEVMHDGLNKDGR
jgi:hypothetical protein